MSGKPKATEWMLDAHSVGKHKVLAKYLPAWVRILGSKTTPTRTIVLVDGFAGPSKYLGGEDGSPVLSAKALAAACATAGWSTSVILACFETNRARAAALRTRLSEIETPVRNRLQTSVYTQDFASASAALFGDHTTDLYSIFAMIDPFGFKQIPAESLKAIGQAPSGELYISFMASWAARFVVKSELASALTIAYGDERWKQAVAMPFGDRVRELLRLYEAMLREIGAAYVLRFDLYNGKSYKYSIFFTTNRLIGCAKMKEAIWSALGGFAYIGGKKPPQMSLDFIPPPIERLSAELRENFAGSTQRIQGLDSWIESDATQFYSGQLRKALQLLETGGTISVKIIDGLPRRANTYPSDREILITFATAWRACADTPSIPLRRAHVLLTSGYGRPTASRKTRRPRPHSCPAVHAG